MEEAKLLKVDNNNKFHYRLGFTDECKNENRYISLAYCHHYDTTNIDEILDKLDNIFVSDYKYEFVLHGGCGRQVYSQSNNRINLKNVLISHCDIFLTSDDDVTALKLIYF